VKKLNENFLFRFETMSSCQSINRVKEKKSDLKMPKPRSPEFKNIAPTQRARQEKNQKESKKTESNDDDGSSRTERSLRAEISDPNLGSCRDGLRSWSRPTDSSGYLRNGDRNGDRRPTKWEKAGLGGDPPGGDRRSQASPDLSRWGPELAQRVDRSIGRSVDRVRSQNPKALVHTRSPVAEEIRQTNREFNTRPSQNRLILAEVEKSRRSHQNREASPERETQPDFNDEWTKEWTDPDQKSVNKTSQTGTLRAASEAGIAGSRKYPEAIANLINLSLMEADKVRDAFKGRRQFYVKIFQAYKDKLTDRDYSIIRGATGYLYENSRIKSINEETALWMLGIYEIPASQIQSYTSKAVLEKIARNCGLSSSGKKAEVLIKNIRSVIDSSK